MSTGRVVHRLVVRPPTVAAHPRLCTGIGRHGWSRTLLFLMSWLHTATFTEAGWRLASAVLGDPWLVGLVVHRLVVGPHAVAEHLRLFTDIRGNVGSWALLLA